MKALSAAAGSWTALLSLFEPEVQGFVARTSGHLDALLGVPCERPIDGMTEPDGYAGFARRGPYQRLLLSEWLFAEEVPDEFLRRAASGEQAFHELARRDPQAKRTLLVLLDAGPDQIGAPRLAHVAALVSLDRRARRVGATLAWAMLGDPSRSVATEVDAVSFTGFVRAHVDRAPPRESARLAIEAASALGPFAELWLIGAASTGQDSVPSARRIVVEESLDPGRRALDISVVSASGVGRSVTIDLPEPRAAIRMLRDPFSQRPAAPEPVRAADIAEGSIDPRRPFYLAPSGRRVFGVTPDGSPVFQPVPDIATARVRRAHVLRRERGESIVAVGLDAKRPIALGLRGSKLILHAGKRSPSATVRDSEILAEVAELLDHGPAELVRLDGVWNFLLLHSRGSFELRYVDAWDIRPSSTMALTHHRSMGSTRRTFMIHRTLSGLDVGVVLPVVGPPSRVVVDGLWTPPQAFAATRLDRGSLVAFREADGRFAVIPRPDTGFDLPRDRWTRVAPAEGEVVGLLASHLGPLLVLVQGAELRVQSVDSGRITFKRCFDAPIRAVACASGNPVVAVATVDNRMTVLETVLAREMLVLGGT